MRGLLDDTMSASVTLRLSPFEGECEDYPMKFSVNWLREFVDLPKNPEEIADLLTRAGVETENIETRGAKIDKVIVSQITASSRHPNADRLTVCEVDDGSGTKRQIVCGATNYKVGDKVPLALAWRKVAERN